MELKEGMMVRVRPGAGTTAGEKGEIVSSFEYTYLIPTNSGLQEVTHTVCRVKFKGKNVTLPYPPKNLNPFERKSKWNQESMTPSQSTLKDQKDLMELSSLS